MTTTFLLYYTLRSMSDPEALGLWQAELGRRLELSGRVAVAPQGMYGIVGGTPERLGEYAAATQRHSALTGVRFCWSEGRGRATPDLRVTVQQDVSGFGALAERQVGQDVLGRVQQLSPHQVHELLAERGSEVVFLDGRGGREPQVGRFRGAVLPDVHESRGIIRDLRSGKLDSLRDRPVVTYCTGGLRSEVLGSLMVQRGFSEVYAIEGGIVSYGSVFADRGLWEGALYVLDDRVQITFSENPSALGHCESCGARTYSYRECVAPLCTAHALLCNGCADFALCAAHQN